MWPLPFPLRPLLLSLTQGAALHRPPWASQDAQQTNNDFVLNEAKTGEGEKQGKALFSWGLAVSWRKVSRKPWLQSFSV